MLVTGISSAQHGGHGGHGGGHTGPINSGYDSSMADLQRSMAVQATGTQVASLHRMLQASQAIRKTITEIQKAQSTELPKLLESLRTKVTAEGSGRQEFVASFSELQRNYLKASIRKFEKASRQLNDVVTELLGSPPSDAAKLAKKTEQVNKAISALEMHQQSLAHEMGVNTNPQ